MVLVDFILNLAAVLLWLNWRSLRFDPLLKTAPATLVGTLKRPESRPFKGWRFLVILLALLLLRALLYWQVGSAAEWTAKLDLGIVVLAFRSDKLLVATLYSGLSFARILALVYFWLLALMVINRQLADTDPVCRLVRLQWGRVARWHWSVQILLPWLVIPAFWCAFHPLLAAAGPVAKAQSYSHVVEQGLLIVLMLCFSLKYLLPPFLFLHFILSYVYLGKSPVWDFISATARHLLAPLRWLPLRFSQLDFTPLVGVVLLFLLLHTMPNLLLYPEQPNPRSGAKPLQVMPRPRQSLWPQ